MRAGGIKAASNIAQMLAKGQVIEHDPVAYEDALKGADAHLARLVSNGDDNGITNLGRWIRALKRKRDGALLLAKYQSLMVQAKKENSLDEVVELAEKKKKITAILDSDLSTLED